MKKVLIIILAIALALGIVLPASFAWFKDYTSVNVEMNSFVHKSYFESGDGTSAAQFIDGTHGDDDTGCAFEIKWPVQLYYFAWLQYLGYFNQPNEDGSTINQTYFYLSANLDMTGWTLPPIGTTEYPFVGNFDGNGHTIANLTIQNVVTGHDSSPTTLNDLPVDSISGANIVGFFGVVGSTNANGTVSGAIESGTGFSALGSYTYTSATNQIKDFALTDVTVKTEASPSLIGIVAGYVNGEVSNVRVGTSGSVIKTGTVSATSYTSNLSDYTLMGFVTDDYKDTSDVVFAKVDTPTEANSHFNYTAQGAAGGWGGSIDMLEMFNRIKNVKASGVTQIAQANHVATEVRRYNADGVMIGNPTQTNGAPSNNFYRMYSAANDGSGQYVISYEVSSDSFMYLASTYKNVVEIHETNDTEPAFYIQHNGTYLNLNNNHNGITNTTPTGGNTKWVIDTDNSIYTQDNDGNKYYLYNNNGTLEIRASSYYYIFYTNGNTTYYLNENNGAIQRSTTATTKWYRSGDSNGTLYTQSSNGNTYYLYNNGNNRNLSLSTTNQTTWSFSENGMITRVSGQTTYFIGIYNNGWTCGSTSNNYPIDYYGLLVSAGKDRTTWHKTPDAIRSDNSGPYLQYDNGWKLIADGSTAYYFISYTADNTTYYLNENNGSIQRGTSATTKWYRSGNGSGTLYTQSSNGNTYYLYSNNTGRNDTNLSLQTNNSTTWTFNVNGRISFTNNYTYYIGYNNSWTCRRSPTYYGTIAQGGTETHTHTALTFTDTTLSTVNRIEKIEPAEFSYIPLGALTTSPYTVIDSNTGYIIAGSHDTTSERRSDIRVSQYAKSNISSGLTGTNASGQVSDSDVRTVDGSGIRTLTQISSLARYADAKKQFNTMLNGTTDVYGLHFMNAEISTDNLIVAPTVKLEGTTYTNYQMPEDSIDFLVHQKGYITFFAGTYFTNNNSFFSLNIIERSEDKKAILSIKEIKQIWKSSDQSKDYIYYLKNEDGTYEWSETKTNDYSLAFNTDWITQPGTTNQLGSTNLYYFEIPVNAGEFALGSVEGRIGAYLLYLDIAANAQLVDRATVIENFEETVKTYEYPTGATFQNTAIADGATDPIIPSALTTLTTSASSNSVTVTDDTHVSFSSETVNYIKDGVTVNGNLTFEDLSINPSTTVVKKIRRTTYYDYNVAKNLYTVTVVEVTQIGTGAISVTINAWNTASDWDIEGNSVTPVATMTTGFTPTIGGNTNGVVINSGASQTLEYKAVDEIYCYLVNVSAEENAQTLRIDRNAFEGTLEISNLLYQFSYAIKDNDDETNGATITYDYNCDIAFNQNAPDDSGLFAFSNRTYGIEVTSTETIHTKVVTAVSNNNYSITLTPTPS